MFKLDHSKFWEWEHMFYSVYNSSHLGCLLYFTCWKKQHNNIYIIAKYSRTLGFNSLSQKTEQYNITKTKVCFHWRKIHEWKTCVSKNYGNMSVRSSCEVNKMNGGLILTSLVNNMQILKKLNNNLNLTSSGRVCARNLTSKF